MKKRLYTTLLLLINLICMGLPLIGHSSFQYNKDSVTITKPILPAVCYSMDTGFFPTIEDALDNAASRISAGEQNLFVIPGTNPTITRDCTIPVNTKLFIPHTLEIDVNTGKLKSFACSEACFKKIQKPNSKDYTNSGIGPIDCNAENIQKFLMNKITIAPGVTLKIAHHYDNYNDGELHLGGQYADRGLSGNYCEILMSKDSQIINEGKFICTGSIKEVKNGPNAASGNTKLISRNGFLYIPMAVYDFSYLGSVLDTLFKNNICPMNAFDFSPVKTTVQIFDTSNFYGKLAISRTIMGSTIDFKKDIDIYNSDSSVSNSLFTRSSGTAANNKSYIEFKYHNANVDDYTFATANIDTFTNYKIKGFYNIGKIHLASNGYTLDTSQCMLPISYRMRLELLKDTKVDTNNKNIKFLPGSQLIVNYGATFTLHSNVVMYTTKDADNNMDEQGYPKGLPDAKFINNGTFDYFQGNFGGLITTTSKQVNNRNEAIVDFTGANASNLYSLLFSEGIYLRPIFPKQAEGLTLKSGATELSVCHFNTGVHTSTFNNGKSYWTGIKHTNKLKINFTNPRNFEAAIYKFDVFICSVDSGGTEYNVQYLQLNGDENKINEFYVDGNQKIKVSTGRACSGSGAFDRSFLKVTSPVEINLAPAEGVYLDIKFYNLDSKFSGRGKTRMTVYESFDSNNINNVPNATTGHWSEVLTFGDEIEKLKIAKNYFFKITIRNPNYNYPRVRYRYSDTRTFPKNYDEANRDDGFSFNGPYYSSTNVIISICGGSTDYL